jgi:hypothetical protein
MRSRFRFWWWFSCALGAQISLLAAAVLGVLPRWLANAIAILYAPVGWLTDRFIVARSEADIGVGLVFVPLLVLGYALVFAVLVGIIYECRDA